MHRTDGVRQPVRMNPVGPRSQRAEVVQMGVCASVLN